MIRRLQIFTIISLVSWGWATTLPAVQPADQTYEQTDLLKSVYQDRDLPLANPADWLGPEAAQWRGRLTKGPEISFEAVGPPFSLAKYGEVTDSKSAQDAFQKFINDRPPAWGNIEKFEFLPFNAWSSRGNWQVTLEQTYQGIPVYGARLEGRINSRGQLYAIRARLFPGEIQGLAFGISETKALQVLTEEPSAQIDWAHQVLFPRISPAGIELVPAYQIRAITDRPDFQPEGIIEARSGEILVRYNDVRFDQISGDIKGLTLPAYWNDPPQNWPHRYQKVTIRNNGTVYSDSSGHYIKTGLATGNHWVRGLLQGQWAYILNDDGAEGTATMVASTLAPTDMNWDYSMARQDELNVYYHVNAMHDYYKSINPEFTGLDFPLHATVGYGTNYENAFWSGNQSGMFFGTGAGTFRNFALFCDVIYHEYGHGVNDNIYPPGMLPYTGQSGAMDEGWADYFACSLTNEPLIGEGGLQTNNQPLRNLDNTLVYPLNWVGEVHADGRIFGGACWDLRQSVGTNVADSVLQYAKYLLSENWEDYFVDVLTTDDNDGNLANGGPHHPQIYESFGLHGIGPGITPKLDMQTSTIVEHGNGDGFYDPGEYLTLKLSVHDSRYLYPPAAQNVTVNVTWGNSQIQLTPTTFAFGTVAPGQTVAAAESLRVTITPQAGLSFTTLFFQITANGGTYQTSDSLEILVGHPNILLVDDDANANFQSFFDASLRLHDYVFSTRTVYSQGAVTLTYLNQFQSVIWMTGNASTNTLTTSDRNTLASYLNGGHNLLLTGQNLVEDIGTSTFFANYLKVSPISGAIWDFSLDGVTGDPISEGDTLWIIGGGGALNQTSPASIAALPGAQEIFHYHYTTSHPAGAVRYYSGVFRTATFAFGLEGVSGLGGTATLGDVLESTLNWFNTTAQGVAQGPQENLPGQYRLESPYPNPFNASTVVRYQMPEARQVSLQVYDTAGRLVRTLVEGWREAGNHQVTFSGGDVASGIYLVRLHTGDFTATQKLILLK